MEVKDSDGRMVWLVGQRLYPERGVKDSLGQSPVGVAWSLGHAAVSFDL